jgi:hypothetical protein
MEKIQISPNSFLQYYFFNKNIIVNVLFIIITLYLNSLYIQNYTLYTLDGKKKYTGYIITALIISILSLLVNILSIIQYYTLFGPTISKTLLFLVCISIINIIIFIIVLDNFIKPVFKTPKPDPTKKSVCKVESQTYSCQQVDADDDKYKNYHKCTDQNTCNRHKQDIEQMSTNFFENVLIAKEDPNCYVYKDSKGKLIGDNSRKYNDLNKIIDTVGKLDKDGKEKFPCPNGTKPYFFNTGEENIGNDNCRRDDNFNGKDIFKTDIKYMCCSSDKFIMTKTDCTNNLKPINYNYCLPETLTLVDTVKLGADYKQNKTQECLFEVQGARCKINSHQSIKRVRDLLNAINQDIWKPNC